jgi:hypothetical protein
MMTISAAVRPNALRFDTVALRWRTACLITMEAKITPGQTVHTGQHRGRNGVTIRGPKSACDQCVALSHLLRGGAFAPTTANPGVPLFQRHHDRDTLGYN